MSRTPTILSIAVLLLLGGGCTETLTSGASCELGAVQGCTCEDGTSGEQACSGATWSACVCGSEPGDAGPDLPSSDVGGIDSTLGDVGRDDVDAGTDGENDAAACTPLQWWPDNDLDGQGDRDADPVAACLDDAPPGYARTNVDCDDGDAFVYVGAPELCDGVDNDCDSAIDETVAQAQFWVDADGDGFGDPASLPVSSCERLPGRSTNRLDCDDSRLDVYPGAEDVCDGADNDCDLLIDEDAETFGTWPDLDEDGFGDRDAPVDVRCDLVEGRVDNDGDCDDDDDLINPDAEEVCDLRDNDCDDLMDEDTSLLLLYQDGDGDGWGVASRPTPSCEPIDGFVTRGGDCDDVLTEVNPDADETCNDRDDNCDGVIDNAATGRLTFWADGDGDTFGDAADPFAACAAPTGYVANDDDCDDREPLAYPGAEEVCDGIDNNCLDGVDEGLRNACGACGDAPPEICADRLDNDCDGTIDESDAGCFCDGRTNQPCYSGAPATLGVGICRGGIADCACPGGARFCTNGTWGVCEGEVLPETEVCDGIDNDCDGLVDEGLRNACGACGAEPVEVCDGLDNDCDGVVDEGVTLACGLCPDAIAGLEETCGDAVDNDCDGLADEGCACAGESIACYTGPAPTRDVGLCRSGTVSCYGGSESSGVCVGQVLPALEVCDGDDNDCDGRVDVLANGCSVCGDVAELCDGVDNDCDGQVDEGLRNACGTCLVDVVPEELGGPALCNGIDDDCDGQVDENLLNACGICDGPCYTDGWDSDAEFATGELDGISPDSGLRLNTSTFTYADVWIANSAENTVSRLNSTTGALIGTFPSGGSSPSRTAVDLDGNAWVANRAFSTQGTVTKFRGGDCTGSCTIFTVNVGGVDAVLRALAVDANNNAWVGAFNERRIYELRGSDGAILNTYNIPIRPYGFAIDRDGILWVAGIQDGIGAFDTRTRTWRGNYVIPACSGGDSQAYGIAIDSAGNVWTGTWNCDRLARLNRADFDAGRPVTITTFQGSGMDNTRGVAIDGDGFVWTVASFNDRLYKFDPRTNTFVGSYATCDQPTGVGIASDGTIWVGCYSSNNAYHHRADGSLIAGTNTGAGPYSYSDLTGFQLRNFTAPRGFWRQVFDCGFTGCSFDQATWTASVPASTTLTARFRTSTNNVDWSAWSGTYTTSPAALDLPLGRYLQVELQMTTSVDEVSPVLTSFNIGWQRP